MTRVRHAARGRSFDSFAEFYMNSAYNQFPQEHRSGGSFGINMVSVDQDPIDMIDAAVPELLIVLTRSSQREVGLDAGDGFRVHKDVPVDTVSVVPAMVEERFMLSDPHSITVTAFHAKRLAEVLDVHGLEPECWARYVGDMAPRRDIARTIKALWAQTSSTKLVDGLKVDALTLQLLAQICSSSSLSPVLEGRADARIAKVIEFIEDHLCDPLSIAELADIAGMSAGHFARCFRATTGETVWDYVQRRRCERAQEMLLYGQQSPSEIALGAGFASAAHMTQSIDARLAVQGRGASIRTTVWQPDDVASDTSVGGLSATALCRVLDWIEDALAEELDLAQLASVAGLSPWHFARCFKAETGITPASFVMHRRIERARVMLANSGDSVTQIAFACGFSSSQHMATTFRRLLGTTPTAYRQERKS